METCKQDLENVLILVHSATHWLGQTPHGIFAQHKAYWHMLYDFAGCVTQNCTLSLSYIVFSCWCCIPYTLLSSLAVFIQ